MKHLSTMNSSLEHDLTFEEVLASCNMKGSEKIDKILSDENLKKDFLRSANKRNPALQQLSYLPLLQVSIEPQEPLSNRDIEALMNNFG
jgi:hypothetical protein